MNPAMRGLAGFLVVVTLVFGASYASAILFSFMGPFSAVGIEQDGSTGPSRSGEPVIPLRDARPMPA